MISLLNRFSGLLFATRAANALSFSAAMRYTAGSIGSAAYYRRRAFGNGSIGEGRISMHLAQRSIQVFLASKRSHFFPSLRVKAELEQVALDDLASELKA